MIRDWIVRNEGRQLSGPQLRFWETVIGLPEDRVSAWLATPERRIWEGGAHVLDCYQRRFGVIDTGHVLAGLCFFDDAEAEPMPVMLV